MSPGTSAGLSDLAARAQASRDGEASPSRVVARLRVIAWMAVYVATLLGSVRVLVAPLFAYQGYVPRDSTWLEIFLAAAATFVIALGLPATCRIPSDVARLFLVLTTAVPVIWVPVLYGPLDTVQVQNLALAVMVSFVVIAVCVRKPGRRLVLVKVSRTTFVLWIGLFVVLALGYLMSRGFSIGLSGFGDVYRQRELYARDVDRIGAYLVGWLAGGTLPVLIAVGLVRRNRWLVLAGLGGVVFLYAITGYKSYAIALAILFGTYVMTRRGTSVTWLWPALLSGVIGLVVILDLVRGGYELTSLVVRRGISTAGINTGYFVDLFDGGPYYELRHSVLSVLGASPYPTPPARLVGETYYSAATAANANFLADGFANWGWAGMLISAVLVGLLLRVFDRVAADLPLGLTAPALVFVLSALSNTAVLTAVATHGAAVLIGWVSLVPVTLAARRRATRADVAPSRALDVDW